MPRRLASLGLILTLAFAGCGGGTEESGEASSERSSAEASPTTTPSEAEEAPVAFQVTGEDPAVEAQVEAGTWAVQRVLGTSERPKPGTYGIMLKPWGEFYPMIWLNEIPFDTEPGTYPLSSPSGTTTSAHYAPSLEGPVYSEDVTGQLVLEEAGEKVSGRFEFDARQKDGGEVVRAFGRFRDVKVPARGES